MPHYGLILLGIHCTYGDTVGCQTLGLKGN